MMLDDIRRQHRAAHDAQQHAEALAAELHRLVAAALDEGHSAIQLADVLDVTRARIYQLRSKAQKGTS